MFNINQGFSLKSAQFNFERDYFKDLAALKAADLSWFPDFFITNVAGILYQLNKSNSDDATTGKWRKFAQDSETVGTIGKGLTDLEARVDKTEKDISTINTNTIPTINEKIDDLDSRKVEVVVGKGLSTNDYTTAEKNKLASLSNYTHPASAAGAKAAGLYKIATDANGHVTAATAVVKADITALGIPAQDTDTHYTTGLRVGASATATANAAASNGSVHLNVMDNTTIRDTHKIVGAGATTVTSDASGHITITSTNTTYGVATTSVNGLMSSTDKTKLTNIATGATADSAIGTSEITNLLTTYFG